MKKTTKFGMMIFVIGVVIVLLYGLYEGFQNINFEELRIVPTFGFIVLIAGLVILFISIVFEQREGVKKMKNEIKKEDLEP